MLAKDNIFLDRSTSNFLLFNFFFSENLSDNATARQVLRPSDKTALRKSPGIQDSQGGLLQPVGTQGRQEWSWGKQ